MTRTAILRPAWTPATIAVMVVGFIIAWPLGLAMIAYILWGDRLGTFKDDVNRATDDFAGAFRWNGRGRHKRHAHRGGYTGNVAFDEWRETELERLEEERRKLNETRREFDEYQRDLRRAKDQTEFDAFMSRRKTPGAPDTSVKKQKSMPPEKARRKPKNKPKGE